jgi:hypothetical protein
MRLFSRLLSVLLFFWVAGILVAAIFHKFFI